LLLWPEASFAISSDLQLNGVLRNHAGELQSLAVDAHVRFYDAEVAGNPLGEEHRGTAEAVDGLFSIPISSASGWRDLANAGELWIEMTLNGETYPRQRVSAAPLAQACGLAQDSAHLGGKAPALYLSKADAASTYLAPDGDGSQLKSLDGAALQPGSLPGQSIAVGAITGAKLAPHTLSATQVHAKYVVSSAQSENAGYASYSLYTHGKGFAYNGVSYWCKPNEILLGGGCEVDPPTGIMLVNTGPFIATYQGQQMLAFRCDYYVTDDVQHTIQAHALCYPSP
jgi:hypothetical protein